MKDRYSALREVPFSLYGLPEAWLGQRLIGAIGWSEGRLDQVELVFVRKIGESSALLKVSVSPSVDDREVLLQSLEARFLRSTAVAPTKFASRTEYVTWRRRADRQAVHLPAHWTKQQFRVDGATIEFDAMFFGQAWVAISTVDFLDIQLRARHFVLEDVELVKVNDIEPYLQHTPRN